MQTAWEASPLFQLRLMSSIQEEGEQADGTLNVSSMNHLHLRVSIAKGDRDSGYRNPFLVRCIPPA